MSDGYLANGKTILCRSTEADRYQSLADIDKPEVRVMVNPEGLNEKFANENLTHATIIGCGIAGFTDEEISPLFEKSHDVENIVLPPGW